MDAPYNLISTISPEKAKRIDEFDKHSKYIVKATVERENFKYFNSKTVYFYKSKIEFI